MNTLELSERINAIRNEKGRKPMQHGNLLLKCRKLFTNLDVKYYKAGKNREYPSYELTQDQILKIIYTESKEVSEILVKELSAKDQLRFEPVSPITTISQLNIEPSELKSTITSLELLDQINLFRKKEGKPEMLHKNLLAIIRDEFEEEINALRFQPVKYKDKKGELRDMFILTLHQGRQVLARESKLVRRGVFEYIQSLEEGVKALLIENYELRISALDQEADQLDCENHKLLVRLKERKDKVEDLNDLIIRLRRKIDTQDNTIERNRRQISALNRSISDITNEKEQRLQMRYKTVAEIRRMFGYLHDARPLVAFSLKNSLPIIDKYDEKNECMKKAYHPDAWYNVHGVSYGWEGSYED